MHNSNIIAFTVIIRGVIEIGVTMPVKGNTELSNSPLNVRIAMLNPTEKRNLIKKSDLIRCKVWTIKNPGNIVRHRNTETCLNMGISRMTLMSVIKRKPIMMER